MHFYLFSGLVRLEFDIEHVAKEFLEDLKDEAKKTPNSPPFPWIEARLKQMGLEVYRHNFNLTFPLRYTKCQAGGEAQEQYS